MMTAIPHWLDDMDCNTAIKTITEAVAQLERTAYKCLSLLLRVCVSVSDSVCENSLNVLVVS